MQIAVVGGGSCNPEVKNLAFHLGKFLAQRGDIILCGGLGGAMEAVSCGASEAGGLVIGILPGKSAESNPWVSVAIATGMGYARNFIIVNSADVVVALPGEYGTLSEIALALKIGKPVISLNSWDITGTQRVETLEDAIKLLDHYQKFLTTSRRSS